MYEDMLHRIIDRYEQAAFTVNRRLNVLMREMMPDDLTIDQFSIMRYLCAHGTCTSSELSDTFCVGKSSITAIIGRLADKRLIARMPDDKDRRVIYLKLTEEGKSVVRLIEQKVHQLLSRLLTQFDPQEAETFIGTYEKLASVLSDERGMAK
ncbi:MarR family winged helix-turn-helix transcriptional regulator [Paenibacillus hodogayensis]|uniref:MarR family winged helix-turn-helix transcriptional regulator n=1 Tax=Paenibacillus hodogayensis TaxID=279208 RepID=A0ABV5VVL2_9BACL